MTFVDHYKTFSIALQYLYEKGYTSIAYCIVRRSGANSLQREKAYPDFHEHKNLSYTTDYIFE